MFEGMLCVEHSSLARRPRRDVGQKCQDQLSCFTVRRQRRRILACCILARTANEVVAGREFKSAVRGASGGLGAWVRLLNQTPLHEFLGEVHLLLL